MIKKTTKIVFQDQDGKERVEELVGGMPLSKGESIDIRFENPERTVTFIVKDKKTSIKKTSKDWLVETRYVLKS